ncbi:hypothetical protein FRC03_006224 [Tulasnella sp. 419]|nr:hypothetical protein FRC03_006224 [Tulasnella sp. 419]
MFSSQRALLNPKFDGYKFHVLDAENSLSSISLPPPGITQSTVPNRNVTPSFEEVQSRIKHNHLSISRSRTNIAAYIDQGGTLVIVELGTEIRFYPVFSCPQPVSTVSVTTPIDYIVEYPVAVSLENDIWLVSDGHGWLYAVRVDPDDGGSLSGALLASFVNEDHTEGSRALPLHLHTAKYTDPQTITAIWSQHVPLPHDMSNLSGSTRDKSKHKHEYDVLCSDLPIPSSPNDSITPLNIKWRRRGETIPWDAWFDEAHNSVVLMAGSDFRGVDDVKKEEPKPAPDELAPIPRLGETLDAQPPVPPSVPPPPPYSWTQTSDSVTVVFPLPSSTPTSAIKVTIAAAHLSLLVHHPHSEDHNPASFPLPRYLRKEFWDSVDPSASFWTWDREGERPANGEPSSVGLLSLHLEKKHEGTKWSHVFRASGTDSTAPEDVEVPETIDPSELWKIRESLEKYTAALSEGEDASGLGLGKGLPSLAQGEMDEDVDSTSGTRVKLCWVRLNGEKWKDEATSWPPTATVLSKPLPNSGGFKTSLVIKQDIDGLLFEPNSQSGTQTDQDISPYSIPWIHKSTYPALAFVLASKRDLKFAYHIGARIVLAFESGRAEIGGNVYMYHSADGNRWARQSILKIGGGTAGALLGVCSVLGEDGKVHVLCLCESQLFILSNLVTG